MPLNKWLLFQKFLGIKKVFRDNLLLKQRVASISKSFELEIALAEPFKTGGYPYA